jgi:transposase
MSLDRNPILSIPPMTKRIARQAFPKGNVYMKMRDRFGTLYEDDLFADLYPIDGQPAYAPWRLALVSVMQFAENLTDRQAADAVRARIDWKYALSLELDDSGFDFSILSEFRQRLIADDQGERLLNELLRHFDEAGLLKGKRKQRTDATHILASVRRLNRLELVGRSLQQALDKLSEEDPDWLREWVEPIWFTRYGHVLSSYRLPKSPSEREALALEIGQDGWRLLDAIYHDPDTPDDLRHLRAIQILRQIWLQQYVWDNDQLRFREGKELPPAHRLIESPFDIDARFSRKRATEWVGYKVHLTETCEDAHPNVITRVVTTPASTPDINALPEIHAGLHRENRLPEAHFVDMGYLSAVDLHRAQADYGVNLVGFLREDASWQTQTGYDISAFEIDWQAERVTCPEGTVSTSWNTYTDEKRTRIRVAFPQSSCATCPARDACTRGKRRHLSFPEQAVFESRDQRRTEQKTIAFQQAYQRRSGVEGTMSQGAFVLGMRRTRYRGLEKVHLQHILTATAMNLTRAMNWLDRRPKSRTRKTRFGRLQVA